MENEDNLVNKVDAINSELVKANAFNEDASLSLDLIYNFLDQNRNLFGGGSSLPNLDNFFDKNGYVPVKVLNPCCHNDGENTGGGLPLPGLPRGGPLEETVPETVPQTAPKPSVIPLPHPISQPIPLTPPTGVVSTPPMPLPTPVPSDAPIIMPAPEPEPDLRGSPVLPSPPESDLNPVIPSLPAVPVTPTVPVTPLMPIDPGLPADSDFKYMLGLGAAVIGASIAAAAVGLAEAGALLGGTGILAAVPAFADEAQPPPPPETVIPKDDTVYSPISYSPNDNSNTGEITLQADEISFTSDVMRFRYGSMGENTTRSVTPNTGATGATTQTGYHPPSSDGAASSGDTTQGGATNPDATPSATPTSGDARPMDVSASASEVGNMLNEMSAKTFMTAKVRAKPKPENSVQSQPIVYGTENTGPMAAAIDNPHPAMTTYHQQIFNKSGMFA